MDLYKWHKRHTVLHSFLCLPQMHYGLLILAYFSSCPAQKALMTK